MLLALAELLRFEEVDDALIEVLAAEEGVAVGRLHLEDAGVQLQESRCSKVPPPRS